MTRMVATIAEAAIVEALRSQDVQNQNLNGIPVVNYTAYDHQFDMIDSPIKDKRDL